MDIKDQLKEVKGLINEVKSNIELIEILKATEESCTATLTDMPHGTDRTDKTKITDRRIMLEDELEKYVIKMFDKIEDTKGIINGINDPIHRAICTSYYLNGKTWREIAINHNCTERNIQHMHGKVLEELRR